MSCVFIMQVVSIWVSKVTSACILRYHAVHVVTDQQSSLSIKLHASSIPLFSCLGLAPVLNSFCYGIELKTAAILKTTSIFPNWLLVTINIFTLFIARWIYRYLSKFDILIHFPSSKRIYSSLFTSLLKALSISDSVSRLCREAFDNISTTKDPRLPSIIRNNEEVTSLRI